MLNTLSSTQLETITLWYLVQHSLSSFYKLQQHYSTLSDAVHPSQTHTWQQLGLHANHIKRLQEFQQPEAQEKFQNTLKLIQQHSDFIITLKDPNYPTQLLPYSDKPPILFGQGNVTALMQPQIAIVGSRKPSPHGKQVAYDFAFYLSEQGFYINSGLAQGIDEAAHRAALQHQRTIAVMGTGLEQTYPTQHRALREEILQHNGAIISEFLPNTPPLQHHFPRRNRIVSGLSLGVIVAEATLKSGSLITAKLAAEQGKTVFSIPGHIYSEYHQGCHQLIREGAILIDHPQQVIEDLALATEWQSMQIHTQTQRSALKTTENSKNTNKVNDADHHIAVPAHLQTLYQQLDWMGQDMDQLAHALALEISILTAQLMELELLGLCTQQSGRYLRCRTSK